MIPKTLILENKKLDLYQIYPNKMVARRNAKRIGSHLSFAIVPLDSSHVALYVEDPDKYYCILCNRMHIKDSKIGQLHLRDLRKNVLPEICTAAISGIGLGAGFKVSDSIWGILNGKRKKK